MGIRGGDLLQIVFEMCEAARAGNDRRNARVRKHELQGRRSQGHAEILANPFDGADAHRGISSGVNCNCSGRQLTAPVARMPLL